MGVGPFSAGTSWRGGRARGRGGGEIVWVIVIGLVLFLALWPYLLGTFIAVQCGAWNPSEKLSRPVDRVFQATSVPAC
ncbi:hypothetical protein AN912_30435 [Mycobacteroides immunogenum]|uniref:Uncharacterized protein n=1 Tax=Mycobacteroides immunogenum TaxID=83262 RepID=A0ABR5LI83_9MYCO|nr:hypothetical protein AN912_30435 [Mycobacteroides immunogenum]